MPKTLEKKQSERKPRAKKQGLTEAQIAVHWKEEEYIRPPARFIAQANLNDPHIVERFSEKNFPECFREYAELLHWDQYWHTTLDTNHPPFWKWFVGGKLNASYNCVDRHLAKWKNKAALIFVPEPEDEAHVVITFQELYRRVNEVAALLREFAGFDTHNIGGDPISKSTEITKSPVHDHEVPLGHDRSRFVLQCCRDALDEIEQTLATWCDMSTMLNVVLRPKSFCGRIVALVEECVERFQNESLILFGSSLRHDDSFRA